MSHTQKIMQVIIQERDKAKRLKGITVETDLTRPQVLRVMNRLQKEGYVEQVADDRRKPRAVCGVRPRNPVWKLTDKFLELRPHSVRRPNSKRDAIWQAIRMLHKTQRKFSYKQVAFSSQQHQFNCEEYMKVLERNGYLLRVPNTGRQTWWLLKNDPGPLRPLTSEKGKSE